MPIFLSQKRMWYCTEIKICRIFFTFTNEIIFFFKKLCLSTFLFKHNKHIFIDMTHSRISGRNGWIIYRIHSVVFNGNIVFTQADLWISIKGIFNNQCHLQDTVLDTHQTYLTTFKTRAKLGQKLNEKHHITYSIKSCL